MDVIPEYTLALVKPDAVKSGQADLIITTIQDAGFAIAAQKKLHLSESQAREFYKEHETKAFFPRLLEFMTSGPIMALALQKENAIMDWRALMGPTNVQTAKREAPTRCACTISLHVRLYPCSAGGELVRRQDAEEACCCSIRAKLGTDGTMNASHGSDSPQSAQREILFFFPDVAEKAAKDAAMVVPEDLVAVEKTLGLIKPDAVAAGNTEEILQTVRMAGFVIVAKRKMLVRPWAGHATAARCSVHRGAPLTI
jgi:nucleoside diphosphate kinase homolog 5